jgi:hypothetical protein
MDAAPGNDWKNHHALGLPGGSVRALIALGMVGTVCGLIIKDPGQALPEPLENLLFVILGHYFAARGQAPADPAGGPPPLYLPRGTVRVLLVAGLVAAGVMVVRAGGAAAPRGLLTLVLVAAFLLGMVMTRLTAWIGRGRKPWRPFEDLRALVGIAAAGTLAAHAFLGVLPGPETIGVGRVGLEQGLAALVGFYFGSRS